MEGGEGGADLTRVTTFEAGLAVTTNGRNNMPAFRDSSTEQKRHDVVTFVLDVVKD